MSDSPAIQTSFNSTPVGKSQSKKYRVKSIWRTLQGEGLFAGRPAVFVRFVGCNMWSGYEADRRRDAEMNGASCPLWCDTEFTKEGSRSLTALELVSEILEIGEGITFCVLTGGEPLLQADAGLLKAFHASSIQVAVESNGTIKLHDAFGTTTDRDSLPDWIVCSPKQVDEALVLEWCDELKLVVPDYQPADYELIYKRIRPHAYGGRSMRLAWLQPEDGPRLETATQNAIELALDNPSWRVSVQTHKVLGVE